MDILDQLSAIESQLEWTTEIFLEKCTVLECVIYPCASSPTMLEALTHYIRSHVDSVERIERLIAKSHSTLRGMTNLSSNVIPIQRLPVEVLSHIFVLTTAGYCGYHYDHPAEPLVAITSVCTRWRHVAIQTNSLWSHVDLSPGPEWHKFGYNLELAQLWLERSGNLPLHIHFSSSSFDFSRWARPDGTTHIVQTLTPFASRISSLKFPSDSTMDLIDAVFKLFETHAIPGNLKKLFVEQVRPDSESHISWPIRNLRGLVDLQLSYLGSRGTPNLDSILAVLASSPTLQVLHLRSIHPQAPVAHFPPIELPELHFLDLRGVDQTSLLFILPTIDCSGPNIHFEVNIYNNEGASINTASFMTRTHISSLCLWYESGEFVPLIQPFLSSLQSLRILVLGFDYRDIWPALDALASTTRERLASGHATLKALVLLNFELDPRVVYALQQLIETDPSLRTHFDNYEDGPGLTKMHLEFIKHAQDFLEEDIWDVNDMEKWMDIIKQFRSMYI